MHESYLVENVRSILFNVGLGKEFWAEASYASHIINKFPLATIGGKTPFYIWFGHSSTDYGHIHLFGCSASYHVTKRILEPRKICSWTLAHAVGR